MVSQVLLSLLDCIVPFSVERFAMQVDLGQFGITHFHTSRICVCIQLTGDLQSRCGACCRNQVYNYLMANQWASAPVLGDPGEKAMLHLIPFTGARREVTDANGQTGPIGKAL